MQDTLFVGNAKTQTCSVERRVFLFEKILIFSEPLERKANLYYYIYTHHIKVCKVLCKRTKPVFFSLANFDHIKVTTFKFSLLKLALCPYIFTLLTFVELMVIIGY